MLHQAEYLENSFSDALVFLDGYLKLTNLARSASFTYPFWTVKVTIPGKLGISAPSKEMMFHCHMHLH